MFSDHIHFIQQPTHRCGALLGCVAERGVCAADLLQGKQCVGILLANLKDKIEDSHVSHQHPSYLVDAAECP